MSTSGRCKYDPPKIFFFTENIPGINENVKNFEFINPFVSSDSFCHNCTNVNCGKCIYFEEIN